MTDFWVYAPTRSDRGLAEFPNIDGIGGGSVLCQESSLATEPAIWLTVEGANSGYATVQLARLDAHKLANQLHILAANHYQLNTP